MLRRKTRRSGRSGQGDAYEGAMRRVTAERSEISPDDRREESPKAMSIRGAERSEGIARRAEQAVQRVRGAKGLCVKKGTMQIKWREE